MFNRIKETLALRNNKKQTLRQISFLFCGGFYIFWQDRVCKLTPTVWKTIGSLKALFFVYSVSNKEPKREKLTNAVVKSGTAKHAVLSDCFCYLVFKKKNKYLEFKENFTNNIASFNYPCIQPLSYDDEYAYITEPIADGRAVKREEIPQLLSTLIQLFRTQGAVTKDENGILYYVQHFDALPGNSLMREDGSVFFIDLDEISSRSALFDFFNVICRTQGLQELLEARKAFQKELETAFLEHCVQYSDSVYDLYLSKFVESRLADVKSGKNNGILYQSIEWVFNPIVKEEFPITLETVNRFQFELTTGGYKVK